MNNQSAAKTPTVWFDVDDVLVETSVSIERALRKMTGKSIPVEAWTHHGFQEMYGFAEGGMDRLREIWLEDGLLERAPLREGAKMALDKISAAGYQIGLITARAWHPGGEQVTWEMAKRHDLPVSKLVVVRYDECKGERLEAMGELVHGFVDDTHRHVRACMDRGWSSCLMDQPWNRLHGDAARVNSLEDFAAQVVGVVAPKSASRPARPR